MHIRDGVRRDLARHDRVAADLLLGKFVRIAYNEVSISDPEAVREVLQSSMDKVCIQSPS
jgi:hypothetical protein